MVNKNNKTTTLNFSDTLQINKDFRNPKYKIKILSEIKKIYNLQIQKDKSKHGTYGDIFFAQCKSNNKYVIKIFKNDITSADVINEISCLSTLKKYNSFPKIHSVVQLLEGKYVAMIIDYCGGTIKPKSILETNRLTLALNFISAYYILYKEQIVHGDIKNNNICIDDNKNLSIIDFGYARRFPYLPNNMQPIFVNKHIELLCDNYNLVNHKIDYLSIFNTIIYFFNCDTDSSNDYLYPFEIETNKDQLDNIIYLILANDNCEKKREKLFNMAKKFTKYYDDISYFHKIFCPNNKNNKIYSEYKNLIKNVPVPIYKYLKKFLNVNPNKRISFQKFYYGITKEYPAYFQKDLTPQKPNFVITFEKKVLLSIDDSVPEYLNIGFNEKYHSTIYSLSFYQFFNARISLDKYSDQDIFDLILYINYATMVNNIYPEYIGVSISNEFFIEYFKYSNGNYHNTSPYTYLNKMRLFRWSKRNQLLFDYFLNIFSSHCIFCEINPYILSVLITIIIYRLQKKLPISIDVNNEYIYMPSNNIPVIPLTKNTLKLFMENEKIRILLDKFYGYYAKQCVSGTLEKIDQYYLIKDNTLEHPIFFYSICAVKEFFGNGDSITSERHVI